MLTWMKINRTKDLMKLVDKTKVMGYAPMQKHPAMPHRD
jgi:hypothetical protein